MISLNEHLQKAWQLQRENSIWTQNSYAIPHPHLQNYVLYFSIFEQIDHVMPGYCLWLMILISLGQLWKTQINWDYGIIK